MVILYPQESPITIDRFAPGCRVEAGRIPGEYKARPDATNLTASEPDVSPNAQGRVQPANTLAPRKLEAQGIAHR